jgi:hypothetical protein
VKRRKELAEGVFKSFVAPGKFEMPVDMIYAQLLAETGWAPDELDNAPVDEVNKMMIYRNVKYAIEYGGDYMVGE